MIALIVSIFALLVFAILLFPVNISFNSVRSGGKIDGSLGVNWIIFLFIYSLKEKELKIPAYTGIITGFLHVLGLSLLGHNIRWTPDFTGQAFDWNVKGRTALIPVRLIPPVAKFITNPHVLRSGWRIIRG